MVELFNPPVLLENDNYTTLVDQPVMGNVLINDSGLNLVLLAVDSVQGGTVTFTPDGVFNFIPEPGFLGSAGFDYIASDACGVVDTASVSIIILPLIQKMDQEETVISIEPVLTNMEIQIPEQSDISTIFLSGFATSIHYKVGRWPQKTRIWMLSNTLKNSAFTLYQFEQRIELCKLEMEWSKITLEGSIGMRTLTVYDSLDPVFAGANATFEFDLKSCGLKAEVSLLGFKRIKSPQFAFSLSVPLLRY